MSILLSQPAGFHRRGFFATLAPALGFFPKPKDPILVALDSFREAYQAFDDYIFAACRLDRKETPAEKLWGKTTLARIKASEAELKQMVVAAASGPVPSDRTWETYWAPLKSLRLRNTLIMILPTDENRPEDDDEMVERIKLVVVDV